MDSHDMTPSTAMRSIPGTGATRVVDTLVDFGLDDAFPVPRTDRRRLREDDRGGILVAEDDPPCRRLLAIRFALSGFQVTECEDGERAWDHLSNRDADWPTIIVTDWNMPNCDGIELAQRVRTTPATAHIPIVLFSSAEPPEIDEVGLNIHYLQKGVRWNEMEALIERICGDRGAARHRELEGTAQTV